MKILIISFVSVAILIVSPFFVKAEDSGDGQDKIIVTEEDIKKMNVHTMVDVLNRIPGVTATENSVNFRGMNIQNILVLLDGRVINNPVDPHRKVNWGMISIRNIEKIEIYKGGGSVLYGEDTSGGVISITTKKVPQMSQGNIEASYGSFDTQRYEINYGRNIKAFGIAISGGLEKTDGFRANDDKDTKRLGAKLSYGPDTGKTLTFSFDHSKADKGDPGRIYSPTPHARTREEEWGSTLIFPIYQLKSKTHLSSFEKRYTNPDAHLDVKLKSWSLREQLSSKINLGRFGSISLGLDAETAHVEGNRVAPKAEQKYSVYTTKEIEWKNIPLHLNMGLRGGIYSDFPSVLNPEVGLNYKGGILHIGFSISKSNNIPTFLQRYYQTTYTKPNPELKMEEATNYSLSLSPQLDFPLEGTISFFRNEIKDRITYSKGADGIGTYINLGSVTRSGIETSLSLRPGSQWLVKTSYTHLVAKDDVTGKHLVYSPKHKIDLYLQWRPIQELTFTMNSKYLSRRFTKTDNSESIPGYFVADADLSYQWKQAKIFLKIANLFDNDYEILDGYPGAPISWTIGIHYEF